MPFKIGNKFLTPAPLVNFQENFVFNEDGSLLNKTYNISLNGSLLPNMGSPSSSGWHTAASDPDREPYATDTEKFNSILAKQELLKEELAVTGLKYSYYPTTGNPIEFYPNVRGLNFQPGTWVIRCDYTVELETPIINRSGSVSDEFFHTSGSNYLNLTSANDSYQITENVNGTQILEINRTISAKAIVRYNNPSGALEAWKNAKTWVLLRRNDSSFNSGFINIIPTGLVYNSGMVYNTYEEESIDQLGGSYTLSQKFLFHHQNYIDNRTITRNISVARLDDGGPRIESISVNGNIQGLDVNNTPSNKMANASGYFNSLISNIGTLVGANGGYINYSRNENVDAGAIDYTFQFINNSGQLYSHTYDVNYTFGSENPVVTINGTISGYTLDDNYQNRFGNAVTGWQTISTGIKVLAFQYPDLTPSGGLFGNLPLNQTITHNKANGTVSYNYTYAFTSGVSLNYQHNYNIDINTDNAPANYARAGLLCTANINGQVVGLASGNNPLTKLDNARVGYNQLLPTIFTLVNNEFSLIGNSTPSLNSGFVRRSISTDQRNGSIGYSATFNNFPPTSHSLVAVEDVTVEDVNPQDVHAVQIIPGRLIGPIIQNIATTTERRRNINIALTLYPSGSPWYFTYNNKNIPSAIASGIASGLLPPGTRASGWWITGDSENWNWKTGFYTRSMSVVY